MIISSVLIAASPPAAPLQRPPSATSERDPPSYYFMLGRHLEDPNKIDEAIAAHKKAIALAPESAELRAELAGALRAAGPGARRRSRPRKPRCSAIRPTARPTGSSARSTRRSSEQRRPFRPGDDPAQYGARAIAALEKSRRERASTSISN